MTKIPIITYNSNNYGNRLQNYVLQEILKIFSNVGCVKTVPMYNEAIKNKD